MENWGSLSHLFITVFLSNVAALMVNPAITDVTMAAVCPGKDECSLAIYLTGFQQAIAGLGSVVMMPLIGNLSDAYGRKTLLTVPLLLSIIPLVILAWKRTTTFFYAYYVFKTLTAMVTQGGVVCIALGYLADTVSEAKRVSAFGVLSGVISAAYVCGTLAARLLSTTQIFQVAAVVSIVAAVYMRVFLKDTTRHTDALEQPILKLETESNQACCESSKKVDFIKGIPSPKDIFCLLKSSITFSLAASIAFFNSLAEAGLEACLQYFLKARFHFMKDQFADVLLIAYIGATISNVIFMPIFGPVIGEEVLLSLGLFAGFLNMFFDSIAWSAWVPYASAALGVFLFLATPNIRSIISKQVGDNEQGVAQGCILGITAFANVISPLIFSPLSALFLSETAPFHFPGFSILCVGLAWLIGFFLSTTMKFIPHRSREKVGNKDSAEA
ncbi:hippocampus abundant transcript 1 [Olea europaea subsp. europaea]|uniref:Hippocampus abundant transcript 1 n=1 Tax=Olea europaea subsp. europaea TaxID=158383 RepID=A0A8S0QYA0_OLEEU|nr:hippocampus abundant transcript 1 [Olea europaea subsp. europaea]